MDMHAQMGTRMLSLITRKRCAYGLPSLVLFLLMSTTLKGVSNQANPLARFVCVREHMESFHDAWLDTTQNDTH